MDNADREADFFLNRYVMDKVEQSIKMNDFVRDGQRQNALHFLRLQSLVRVETSGWVSDVGDTDTLPASGGGLLGDRPTRHLRVAGALCSILSWVSNRVCLLDS